MDWIGGALFTVGPHSPVHVQSFKEDEGHSTLPTGEVGLKYYALKKSSPFVNSRRKWTSPIENGLQR